MPRRSDPAQPIDPAERPGPVALVGSGEYLPVMDPIDAALLDGRPRRTVQVPTAAAQEGSERLDYWRRLGRESAARLGVEQVVLPVVDRASADDLGIAALVDGAGLIYLSGGNPPFLANTLRGTAVWTAIEDAWRRGAALAGCSAGAMALTSTVVDFRDPNSPLQPGLGVVPRLRVIPHFDAFDGRVPDTLLRRIIATPTSVSIVGIDEDTALVAESGTWRVLGRQSAWVLDAGQRREFPSGSTLDLPYPALSQSPSSSRS